MAHIFLFNEFQHLSRTPANVHWALLLALLHSFPRAATGLTSGRKNGEDDGALQLVWERPGHLQLGVVLSLTTFHKDRLCGPMLRRPSALHRLHAIVFAMEEINERDDLLPNVSLGFVVMDDCSRDAAALLRALRFIPRPACPDDHGFSSWGNSSSPSPPPLQRGVESEVGTYPVVGVIGAELSESSMQMAALLSAFRVPQLSYASSSPFLSNKNKYGYFSRIVPSDRQQAMVIVDMLQQFQWTYVAVVYSYGVYGLSGFRYIRGALERKGFCLAASVATESEFRKKDYEDLVKELVNIRPEVRVVVLFTVHAGSVLRATRRLGLGGRFVWVSSDTLVPNVRDFEGYEDVVVGLLLVGFKSAPVKRFEDEFQYSTLRNSSENPWFSEFYQSMFQCSTNQSSPLPVCDPDLPLLHSPLYERNTSVMRAINSVYAFAYALHNVIKNCSYTPLHVTKCFTSEELLHSLRQTHFVGENNVTVGIDSVGDGIATYQVRNFRVDDGVYSFTTVGEWDGSEQRFTQLDMQNIMWHPSLSVWEEEKEEGETRGIPSSTCSEKCAAGQQAIPIWPRCCWVCKACRENEHTVVLDGLPACHPCPSDGNFTWPDSATRTKCQPIAATFLSFGSPLGTPLLALDLLVLALVLTCTALYVRSRASRLIKATSRELSAVMLCGHALACLTVPVFLLEPSPVSCLVAHSSFHVSLTLVYAPLLVKIHRIHRIFVSAKQSARKLRFIGSGFQLLVSLAVVLAHLSFIVIWMILSPPTEQTRMPSFNRQYVERVCAVSERGFLASLVVNLALMAACAVHSWSTRRLPANYNEAKFIVICVYTIAVLWLSFLATYFLLAHGVVQTLCLVLALLVNVISCQVFLFIPKLYAVYKVPSCKLHVLNAPENTEAKTRIRRLSRPCVQ